MEADQLITSNCDLVADEFAIYVDKELNDLADLIIDDYLKLVNTRCYTENKPKSK